MRISDWSSDGSSDLPPPCARQTLSFGRRSSTPPNTRQQAARDCSAGMPTSHGSQYLGTDSVPIMSQGCARRSEEHTSELQSLMRISYAVFCLKTKKSPSSSKCQKDQAHLTIHNTTTNTKHLHTNIHTS